MRAPVATYRLQLMPDFGFREARELVPYLRDLGISHLYLSPSLQARSGSAHGYDEIFVKLAAETAAAHPVFDAYTVHFADAYDDAPAF